jgi:hypothetical protein
MDVLALLTGFVASYVANEQVPVDVDRRVAELRAAIAGGGLPHPAAVLAAPGGPQRPDFDRIAARMINGLVGRVIIVRPPGRPPAARRRRAAA